MAENVDDLDERIKKLQEIADAELKKAQKDFSTSSSDLEKSEAQLQKINDIVIGKIDPHEETELQKELDLLKKEMGLPIEPSKANKPPTAINSEAEIKRDAELIKSLQEIDSAKEEDGWLKKLYEEQAAPTPNKTDSIPNVEEVLDILDKQISAEKKDKEKSSQEDGWLKKAYEEQATPTPNNIEGSTLSKLYGGLKFVVSKTINAIKDLGKQSINAISSLFKKTPKEPNIEVPKANSLKTPEELKTAQKENSQKIKRSQAILKGHSAVAKSAGHQLAEVQEQQKAFAEKRRANQAAMKEARAEHNKTGNRVKRNNQIDPPLSTPQRKKPQDPNRGGGHSR